MGLLKGGKPSGLANLIETAMQGQAQSAQLQVDQQTAERQATTTERDQAFAPILQASAEKVTPEILEPVAGLKFEQFVDVCQRGAAHTRDDPKVLALAAAHGVDAASWAEAFRGWNERIGRENSLASKFAISYRGANQ
jgi:hypothetical protein